MSKHELKQQRLALVNKFIAEISSCGRRFFYNQQSKRLAKLEVDQRGRVWFIDDYTGQRIYTHYSGRWHGFTHGGTLKRFVEALRDFIVHSEELNEAYFYEKACGMGNAWGYGADLETVRQAALRLGIARQPK